MFALATLMQGYNIKLSPLDALLCVRGKKHYIEVTRHAKNPDLKSMGKFQQQIWW